MENKILFERWLNHPDEFIEQVLGIKLKTYEKIILRVGAKLPSLNPRYIRGRIDV